LTFGWDVKSNILRLCLFKRRLFAVKQNQKQSVPTAIQVVVFARGKGHKVVRRETAPTCLLSGRVKKLAKLFMHIL
jgi:hypothetical protein